MDILLVGSGIGFGIGLVLGLLGGGGSILTVPALVYIIGLSPQVAVTSSLLVVGANSMIGAMMHRAQGTMNWHVAIVFGGTGMIAAYFSAGLSKLFAPNMLLIAFALLMLLVGGLMIFSQGRDYEKREPAGLPLIIASGLVVGILTGLLGVGGGFLIVPALVMLVGLPMRQAVGTSLVIIAMNSIAGLLGHMGESLIDLNLILVLIVAGILGTMAGTRLAHYVQPQQLRKIFALFIIVLSLFLLYDNLGKMLV